MHCCSTCPLGQSKPTALRTIIAAVAAAALAGCSTPRHTDLLVFGTDTKVALDVSADTVGKPSLTLGYRRTELVLMPLVVNGAVNRTVTTGISSTIGADKENGQRIPHTLLGVTRSEQTSGSTPGTPIGDYKYQGAEGTQNKDTYSVIATFRGAATGSLSSDTYSGNGQIAQFFATGLAARLLAKEGGAGVVSNVPTPPGAVTEDPKTQAEAAAFRNQVDVLVNKIVSKLVSHDYTSNGNQRSWTLGDKGITKEDLIESLSGINGSDAIIASFGDQLQITNVVDSFKKTFSLQELERIASKLNIQ